MVDITDGALNALQNNDNKVNQSSNGSQGGFSLSQAPGSTRHHPAPVKVLAKQNDDNYLTEVESERLVDAYIKFKSRGFTRF